MLLNCFWQNSESSYNISVETTFRILSQCIMLCCYPLHNSLGQCLHLFCNYISAILWQQEKCFLPYRLHKGIEGRRRNFRTLQLPIQVKKHCTLLRLTEGINDCLVSPQRQPQMCNNPNFQNHYTMNMFTTIIYMNISTIFVSFGVIIYHFFAQVKPLNNMFQLDDSAYISTKFCGMLILNRYCFLQHRVTVMLSMDFSRIHSSHQFYTAI